MSPIPHPNFTRSDNPLAYELYEKLLKAGVKPEDLDGGASIPNISGTVCRNEESSCLVGKGDGYISPEEVLDVAFQKGGRFRATLFSKKKIMAWALDDGNPRTTFDAAIRKRVDQAIKTTSAQLIKKGFKPHTADFDRGLATALALLVALPDAQTIAARSADRFESVTKPLANLGLEEFQQQLKTLGGLRTTKSKTDELDALEALARNEGDCMELSRILYGTLKQAALKPFFVLVLPQKGEVPAMDEVLQDPSSTMQHMCVGLEIDGKRLLLDPALFLISPPYKKVYPLSEVQFEAMTENHRALIEKNTRKNAGLAEAHFQKASALFPSHADFHVNFAINLASQGKYEEEIHELDKALHLNPHHREALMMRADFYRSIRYWDEAIQDLELAHLFYPDDEEVTVKLAGVYCLSGQSQSNDQKFNEALVSFNRALQIDPQMGVAYFLHGLTCARVGKMNEAHADFISYVKVDSMQAITTLNAELKAILRDKWEASNEVDLTAFQENMRMNPWDVEFHIEMASLCWETGKVELAKLYLAKLAAELGETKPEADSLSVLRKLKQNLPQSMLIHPDIKPLLKKAGLQ